MSNQPENENQRTVDDNPQNQNTTAEPLSAANQNENSSSSSEGVPVIGDGALCTCPKSPGEKVAIKALSQSQVAINGGSILAVTTNDKTAASLKFSKCGNKSCAADITWQNAYADTQILGSLQILTMNSFGICAQGGKIEFATCGQSEQISPTTTNDIIGKQTQQLEQENPVVLTQDIASEVNSGDYNIIDDLEQRIQELLEQPVIEVLAEGAGASTFIGAIKPVTYPQAKIRGTVKQPRNTSCTFKSAASGTYHWKIRSENMSVLKEADGAGQITIRFPKLGRYVIEAYKTKSYVKADTSITDIDSKSDDFKNALIVEVVENELTLKASKTECATGDSVTIAVEKLFDTLDLDSGQISYQVLSQGLPLADPTRAEVSGNDRQATAKFNTDGTYVISATSSKGVKVNPTESIKVKRLSVQAVTAKGQKQYKARKGEELELKAELNYDTPENQQRVKWEVYYSSTQSGIKTKCYPIAGGAILNNKPSATLFEQTGFYFIYAFCAANKTESVKAVVEIGQSKFVTTTWMDLNGNNIQEVGKKEAVYANIQMEGVNGLDLTFEVYCYQTGKMIQKRDARQMQSNKAIYTLKLSQTDVKELNEGDQLYIKPVVRNNTIRILDKDKAPSHYRITYTTVRSIRSISLYSDRDCRQPLVVGTIGETIYARVLTRNLSQPNLNIGIFRKLDASFNVSEMILHIDNQPIKDDGSVVFEIVTKKGWQTTSRDNYLIYAMETDNNTVEYSALLELFLSNRANAQLKINQNVSFLSLTNSTTNAIGQNRTITTVNQLSGNASANGNCPRCNAAIRGTKAECKTEHEFALKEIFPNVSDDTLKTVANTYSKYMRQLGLNTCWQKAHFFAQAAVETGYNLHISKGEGMGYTRQGLEDTFPSKIFNGKWIGGKWVSDKDNAGKRIYKSGAVKNHIDAIYSEPAGERRNKAIANFVYANTNGNGDEASGDGWRFRGSGLVQLTGRGNFQGVYNQIKSVWTESILTDTGAEKVRTSLELAVLTSMGYFKMKKANTVANGEKDEDVVSKLVGLNIGTNHADKKKFFENKSSVLFKTSECKYEIITSTLDETELITYHIFASNRTIVKQIPKENKHPEYRKYIYHDKDGGKHLIGDFSLNRVKKIKTKSETKVDSEGKVELVHFNKETFKGYKSPDGKVKCKVAVWDIQDHGANGGKREYINPECLAGLLGAMLDYNVDFLTFRGSSNKTGNGYPSVSHANGLKTDIAYFKKNGELGQVLLQEAKLDLDLNVKFINALIDYGYKTIGDFCTEEFIPYGQTKKRYLVDGMLEVKNPRHNNHLHIGGFQFNTVKIKQDE